MVTHTENANFTRQIISILLMTAGWGWTAGTFTPDTPIFNAIGQFLPVVLLIFASLRIFRPRTSSTESNGGWAIVAVSVLAILSILITVVMIILGATNSDPNGVGSKTLADHIPEVILNAGTLLWLTTLLPVRRKNAEARTVSRV